MKISVVIPVHNYGQFLGEAIESVLEQTIPVFELIVVNDGSTDNSSKVANSYDKVILLEQKHAGVSSARNAGANIASGDYIAFLDADDIWLPEKIEKQICFLQENPKVGAVYGQIQQYFSQELGEAERASYATPPNFQDGLTASSVLTSKSVYDQVGGFNETLRCGEFIDWHARLVHQGFQWRVIPEIVTKRRIHKNNTFQRDPSIKQDFLKVIKASIDRRRENT